MSSQKEKLLLFGILILFVLAIPLTIVLLNQQHETRSRASTELPIPAAVCGSAPTDIMLIIDKSGSMNNSLGNTSTTKLAAAKQAATNFVTIISANTQNHIGLTTFQTTATLNAKLSNNFSNVKTQINGISAGGNTCTECGAKTTDTEIHTDARTGFKKVAILLTDGLANTIIGNTQKVSTQVAEDAAIKEIQTAHAADGTIYFTIGLGNRNGTGDSGIDEPFLQKIAQITGGNYYYSPSTNDLDQIYQNISQILGKGAVTGAVFNDMNNNGILDASESGLPGWTVNLRVGTASATPIATATTDSAGAYSFPGLCDGAYIVDTTLQSGWSQSLPTNPKYYVVSIANGNDVKDKNFGVVKRACGTACTSNNSCEGATNSCTTCTNNTCQINYCGKSCTTNADCGSQSISQCGLCDINGSKKCVAALSPTNTPTPTATPTQTPTPTQINFCGKTCTSNSDCQGNGSTCQFCDSNGDHKCVGSISPTPTSTPSPTPGAMSLNLDVLMHNIGNGGDNHNTTASLSNKDPLHPNRPIHVFAYDVNNQLIVDKTGTITYSSASGSFKGTLDLGTSIPTGQYYMKIQSDYHLRRLVSGLITLTTGTINNVPQVSLVAGDADNDNTLSLLDYNMLIGCYSVLQPARSCTNTEKLATDFNDDGNVDGTDYNLFLTELSVQNGD